MSTESDSLSAAPVLPAEGRHVLHAFFRLDRARWNTLTAPQKDQAKVRFLELAAALSERPATQLLLLSHIGPEADWGFMLLIDDLRELDRASKALAGAFGPGVAIPVLQYFSLTESSEYTTSTDEYLQSLEKDEGLKPDSAEWSEKRTAFESRMKKYLHDRLYPNLPDWPVVCFYPMSKRRVVGQNWYALPFAERKELMKGHARVGRTYAGRILQLITGSTGLDAMEWGVTLFAREVSEIKAIVYEMRFDPVSAEYADFGDFTIGLQMKAEALWQTLGLPEQDA
jgi:peroxiredoxin